MGLMDKLRAELIDIIEWVDDSHHTLVWRFPRYHNQIKHGAQLVVRPGQTAVFVREGVIADVFGPGQHRLETRNLPIRFECQVAGGRFNSYSKDVCCPAGRIEGFDPFPFDPIK